MPTLSKSNTFMIYYYSLLLLIITALFQCSCCYGRIVPELYLNVASPPPSSSSTTTTSTSGIAVATLEPTIKVTTQGSLFNNVCDYSGGITVRANMDGNQQELPISIWGTIQKKSFLGWDWKARLDTASSSNWKDVDFDVQTVGGPTNILLRASGQVNTSTSRNGQVVQNVSFKQGVRLPNWIGGGRILFISPSYNILSKRSKLGVSYDASSQTQIMLDVNKDQQKVTIAHAINDSNTIIPSITSNGNVAIDYHYVVPNSDGGVLTTKYRPNDATAFEYQNGPWIASTTIPMEGYYTFYTKPNFFIRRALTVE